MRLSVSGTCHDDNFDGNSHRENRRDNPSKNVSLPNGVVR